MSSLLELPIKKMVYGGYSLAEHGGKKFLVRYAIPGETVLAEAIKEKKGYVEVITRDVSVSSPFRKDPPCKYYYHCGGCQLQHIEYDKQVKLKGDILLESLSRIGKLETERLDDSIVSKEELNYRIKVQFKVEGDNLGFFAWGTKNLVSISECLVVHPAINQTIGALKELCRKIHDLQEVHVFYSPSEDELLLKLITVTPFDKEKLRGLKQSYLPDRVVGIGNYSKLGEKLVERYHIGRNFTYMQVGGYRYRVSNDSFFQVNYTLWEEFIRNVAKESYGKVLELYCGAGFFSIPLSETSSFILASDTNPSAIKDADYSAKINRRHNIVFSHESAYRTLKNHAGEIIDLLLIDPPRTGMTTDEVRLILQNKPRKVLYVSCNPTTLARDIKALVSGGYRLKSVKLIDNFPQTYHIESISE
ncbi:MAG: 23S rRNA (uracil(1939)-C(5))-methyltransferase RlmD, partial [Aquificaceae bacterium]